VTGWGGQGDIADSAGQVGPIDVVPVTPEDEVDAEPPGVLGFDESAPQPTNTKAATAVTIAHFMAIGRSPQRRGSTSTINDMITR
jgi:hypothetical protein